MAALAIFAGPQHYITPSWYPAKTEHGKVVPAWNYIVVHAYGRLETYDDRESLLANVVALTTHHEASRPEPWKVSDAPASYIDAQLKGIIGISLRIDRLEGKWKISQNRSAADQPSDAAALHAAGTDASVAMAETMACRYQPRTFAKISGATMVASDSMMYFGVSSPSLPQVIFSFGTAPEYEP